MLTFCNSYSTAIATCISFWEPEECGGDGNGWHNIGWYWVDPGTCRVVFRNDVNDVNRYWYYYAEAADGTKWAGDFPTYVKDEAFDHCDTPPDTTMHQVGFRELDVDDADNYTLTFLP
jgi:uncharacterized membrane protein